MAQIAIIDKCDLCQAEENVNFFCIDCDEILCTICKVGHAKSRISRNHRIISLLQAKNENIVHKSTIVYCSEHSTVEVTLFCLKCDQLICNQCVAHKHKGHGLTTPDEIRDSKAQELNKFINTLKEKKVVYENAFQAEGQVHSQFMKSIDKVREEISDQKAKIIGELNIVCNEQNAELTKLQQSEDKRYSNACNEIQAQNQAVTSVLQTVESSMDSKNSALIIQATVDTAHTLQGLQDTTIPQPQATTVMYQCGDRNRDNIQHIQGKVNILTQGAKPKPSANVKFQEQKTSGDKKQPQQDDNKPSIDVNKVKVTSTIRVKDIGNINVIVPLMNKTAWVTGLLDQKRLSLVDSTGKIITKSVSLSNNICDAKAYRNGLLITCWGQCKIILMSADGKSTSTFSDLSPYYTRGLCVTEEMEAIVCLYRSSTDSKVVIIQTIQHDVTGAPLYYNPWKVTSLATGEIIVVDGGNSIVGVDRKGQHLFTCKEIQGKKLDRDSNKITDITHDSNNNLFVTAIYSDRVYVLGKDGSGAMCILDRTQGIDRPLSVAVNSARQLWVGCNKGEILIIEY